MKPLSHVVKRYAIQYLRILIILIIITLTITDVAYLEHSASS